MSTTASRHLIYDNKMIKTHTAKTEIGPIIKAKLKEGKHSVVWFAQQLGCSRTNAYKIFGKHSIDTEELMKISMILKFDFFNVYSSELCQKIK